MQPATDIASHCSPGSIDGGIVRQLGEWRNEFVPGLVANTIIYIIKSGCCQTVADRSASDYRASRTSRGKATACSCRRKLDHVALLAAFHLRANQYHVINVT